MMDKQTLAREILKAIGCLDGVKKLHYSFTGEKYALSDVQAVINGHTEQLAQLVLEENPRLVSYALDGSTCCLCFDGKFIDYNTDEFAEKLIQEQKEKDTEIALGWAETYKKLGGFSPRIEDIARVDVCEAVAKAISDQ